MLSISISSFSAALMLLFEQQCCSLPSVEGRPWQALKGPDPQQTQLHWSH